MASAESAVDGKNVGILAAQVYIPQLCISQAELEKVHGCAGKYTAGLGQVAMSLVCGDLEDVNSICLTVVQSLLET
jgi:hydroxymethylglutaryl-CoA synthase